MSEDLRQVQENGRCRSEGQHSWFFSDRPGELALAQQVCAGCEVRAVCLELALGEGHDWGVWGGVIFWDGQPFHRRRGRGRPRHADSGQPLEADRNELWEQVKSA